MMNTDLTQTAEEVRRFNRFYTRKIGDLNENLLRSPFSLAEARIIYELAHREKTTATELSKELGMDPGYLSRILAKFKRQDLIEKQVSKLDGRQTLLWLSKKGRQSFAGLNASSQSEIENMLRDLSSEDCNHLIQSMHAIERLLGSRPESKEPYILRPPRSGDIGWVVHRHGILYSEEYGWNEQFEGLVAEIAAHFIQNFDPKVERCWIAEREGEIVGSVFLVKLSPEIAKLRMLWVEPKARGLGIGERLVEECIRFARQAGYHRITLWTNSILLAARHIYQKKGFRLIKEEPLHDFGQDLTSETWELEL
jgi:DNA-binding MarR family transcriptional regulator/N-acetylglutamate synthase-like GNAT family acetyltransferase